MKKLLSLITVFIVILAGCGGSSGDDDDKTISFAYWDDIWTPAFEEIAKEFESQNPGVTIDLQVTPYSSYWTKLDTIASTGDGPDVFIMNVPNIEKYSETGMLAPLDDSMEKYEVRPEDFVDRTFDAYEIDGATYGVPFDYDVTHLFYNADLLEEIGISSIPETWDEMLEVGQQVIDYDSSLYPFVISGNQAGYWPIIVSQNGQIITDDGKSGYELPETIASIQWIQDAVESGIIPKSSSIGGVNPIDALLSGQAVFAFDGSWMIPKLSEDATANIGIAPIPSNNDNRAGVIHAPSVAVNASGDNVDIASDFAAFVGSDFAQERVASTMNQLPAKKGFDDKFIANNPNLIGLDEALDYTSTAVVYPHVIDGTWENVEIEDMNKVMDLKMSPEDAATDITAAIQKSSER